MAFLKTVPVDQADDTLRALYAADLKNLGYVANHSQAFSLRPDVLQAWRQLLGAIRSKMRLRRYELVTFAVAAALRCSY
jgi:hypothetical protein